LIVYHASGEVGRQVIRLVLDYNSDSHSIYQIKRR